MSSRWWGRKILDIDELGGEMPSSSFGAGSVRVIDWKSFFGSPTSIDHGFCHRFEDFRGR
jgi:hypothetical protein